MGKWTLERVLMILGIAVTIGVQLQLVRSQQNEIDALKKKEETLSERYVPREVYNVNQKNLTDAIDRLTRTLDRQNESLERLYAIEKETGEPARIQGMAERGLFGK